MLLFVRYTILRIYKWLDIHFLRHENNNNPKGMFRTKDRCLIKTFKIENNHNKALLCRFAQNILNN